jgi:hypothetical protein
MLKIVSGGYAAQLPCPVLHQYHLHVSSSRPSKSLAFVNATLDDYLLYGRLRHMNGVPDRPNWGFSHKEFKQIVL